MMRKSNRSTRELIWPLMLAVGLTSSCLASNPPQEAKSGYRGVHLEANHSYGLLGEPVHIRFTVTNDTQAPIIVESEEKPMLDLQVVGVANKRVYQSWAALHPDQALHRVEWQPGESKVLEMDWIPTPEGASHIVGLDGQLNQGSELVQGASVCTTVWGDVSGALRTVTDWLPTDKALDHPGAQSLGTDTHI